MGIFASLAKSKAACISPDKKDEFKSRVFDLFDKGGMLQVESYTLYGKKYFTLKRLQKKEDIWFCYNYFDDDTSEDAGFNGKELRVWSTKLVGGHFYRVVLAAYALEGLYNSGINVVDDNGDYISGDYYIAWLNSLFGENYLSRSMDPWDAYLSLKSSEYDDLDPSRFRCYKNTFDGYLGYLDVMAVEEGCKALDKYFSQAKEWAESDEDFDFRSWRGKLYRAFKESLKKYSKRSIRSKEEQLAYLVGMLRDMYIADDALKPLKKYRDEGYEDIYLRTWILSSPAITIKLIAELYEKDFWSTWEKISDVAKRDLLSKDKKDEVYEISSEDFLNVSTDDLVLYWASEKPLHFSEEMQAWLHDLKKEYDNILEEKLEIGQPLRYVKEILDYAEEHYSHIYMFSDFVDETMDNITNTNFMALWILFAHVLHVKNNLEASKVLVAAAKGYEDDANYVVNRHRVCDNWSNVRLKYMFNRGRTNVRRYVALIANKDLRNKIFGI